MNNESFRHQLLVVAPHPDDAELFCGGLILQMVKRGYRVAIVDLSEAELSSNGTPELRREETKRASSLMGISTRVNLGLPNCWFHECSGFDSSNPITDSAAGLLVKAIRDIRPEIVVAPYAHDRHPDHVQGALITTRAVFLSGLVRHETPDCLPFTPRQVFFYAFRYEFNPSFILDISDVATKKYEVIDCYKSQVRPQGDTANKTLLSSPLSLHALQARDAHMGAYIGAQYGEGYLSRTSIRIDDPIAHVRLHPTSDAYFFRMGDQ